MKQVILFILTFVAFHPSRAQFTQVTNPSENFYLGSLGVVESKDTLFTTTGVLSGFTDYGVKMYFSVDAGETWSELVPSSGMNNSGLEIATSGFFGSDLFLVLA